jgi:hypothetical protein
MVRHLGRQSLAKRNLLPQECGELVEAELGSTTVRSCQLRSILKLDVKLSNTTPMPDCKQPTIKGAGRSLHVAFARSGTADGYDQLLAVPAKAQSTFVRNSDVSNL